MYKEIAAFYSFTKCINNDLKNGLKKYISSNLKYQLLKMYQKNRNFWNLSKLALALKSDIKLNIIFLLYVRKQKFKEMWFDVRIYYSKLLIYDACSNLSNLFNNLNMTKKNSLLLKEAVAPE